MKGLTSKPASAEQSNSPFRSYGSRKSAIQTKLQMNKLGNEKEMEANQASEKVVNQPKDADKVAGKPISHSITPLQSKEEDAQMKEEETVQSKEEIQQKESPQFKNDIFWNNTSQKKQDSFQSKEDVNNKLEDEDPKYPRIHTLRKGENLSILAKRYFVTVEDLKKWNPSTVGRENKLQIGEDIIVADPKVAIPKSEPGDIWSEKEFNERMNNKMIRAMALGISTAANKEYGEGKLSPEMYKAQKQSDFKESGLKTVSILMMEFFSGTGPETRVFHESKGDAITEDVKWSAQTWLALNHLEDVWMKGEKEIGEPVDFTSQTSPGQTGILNAIWAHGNQFFYNRTSFYLGGMDYTMWIYQDKILFKVVNEFSISSGVTKDDGKSNLIRIDGAVCPLGNTTQVFWFTHSLPQGPPKRN